MLDKAMEPLFLKDEIGIIVGGALIDFNIATRKKSFACQKCWRNHTSTRFIGLNHQFILKHNIAHFRMTHNSMTKILEDPY